MRKTAQRTIRKILSTVLKI